MSHRLRTFSLGLLLAGLIVGIWLTFPAIAADGPDTSGSKPAALTPEQLQVPSHAQLSQDLLRVLQRSKSNEPLNFGAELGLQHACFVLGYQSALLTTAVEQYTLTGDGEWLTWFGEQVNLLAQYFANAEDRSALGIDVLMQKVDSKDPAELALAMANFKSLAETVCLALGGRDAKWFFMLGCNDWYMNLFMAVTEGEGAMPELSFPGKSPGFISQDLAQDAELMEEYSMEVKPLDEVTTFYQAYTTHFFTYFGLKPPEQAQT